ncbi:MAG: GerAB/ArcD/ProY family transporter [Clostridia bacterium]|nr:GerAB/ArcD/ProY family transporter [Clostridia bacterium]
MKTKSGSVSIGIICSCAILSKYLVILPEYMVKLVGNAAWLDVFAKCAIASISLLFVLWLYKPFAPMCLSETFSLACGEGGKIFFSYIYVISLTIFNALLLRLLVEALGTVMATTAPDEFFALFILVPVFVAAYSGTRATINLSAIIFPLLVVTIITVVLALIPHYRVENLFPILGTSTKNLMRGIFVKHFGFPETILLFFFAPMLENYKNIKRAGLLTFLIVALISVSFTLAYCLTVPYPASKNFFLPFYQMTRMIKSGAFLQRLEPIVVFVWTSFVMCSMSILISTSASLLSGSREREKKSAFVPVITIITFFVSMLPSSEGSAFYLYEKLLSYSTFLFPTLPVIILTIARIRRKAAKK